MNRYSNVEVSAYHPMTTQEIWAPAAAMRQQHNEADKQLQTQIAELDKVDPLSVHYEKAQKIKADLLNTISNQAETLATQGFNGNTTAGVYKTNRDIQSQFSPTGELGQINLAKKTYDTEKAQYLDDAVKESKIGREQALKNWENYAKTKYTGYSEDGKKITNIGALGAARYQDFDKDIKEVHDTLGYYSKELAKSGYKTFVDPKTNKVMFADAKGNFSTKSNIKQLDNAMKSFNERWYGKEGEGRKWAEQAGLDINNLKNQSDNRFNSMIINDTSDTRGYNYSIPESLNQNKEIDPGGVIISNDSTLTSNATSQQTYSDALNNIKKLSNSKTLSSADRSKLEDLKELRKNADNKLNQNGDYKLLDSMFKKEYSKWDRLSSKMNLSQEEKEMIKNNPNSLPQLLFSKGFGSFKGSKSDPDLKLIMDDKNISNINNILNKRQVIKDNAWNNSSSLRHNYSYLPSTPKEESEWNLHNENVYNVLKGVNLGNVLDLTSINTTSGSKKNIEDVDVQNIQELLKHGDAKSFKINNIKTYGDNKTPEITMTFNTTKEASQYDMDRGLFDAGRSDKYGGPEEPVTVTFKLKKFSNSFDTGSAAGYKNLTGAIANFWKNKGGVNEITGNFQGAEVYNSMIENSYSGVSDKELYARAQSDSDAREALLIRVAKHENKKQ